jgi:hypothetical protein
VSKSFLFGLTPHSRRTRSPHGLFLKRRQGGGEVCEGYDAKAGVGGVKDLYAAMKCYTGVSVPQNRIYEFSYTLPYRPQSTATDVSECRPPYKSSPVVRNTTQSCTTSSSNDGGRPRDRLGFGLDRLSDGHRFFARLMKIVDCRLSISFLGVISH